jgi:hypothetical protein
MRVIIFCTILILLSCEKIEVENIIITDCIASQLIKHNMEAYLSQNQDFSRSSSLHLYLYKNEQFFVVDYHNAMSIPLPENCSNFVICKGIYDSSKLCKNFWKEAKYLKIVGISKS